MKAFAYSALLLAICISRNGNAQEAGCPNLGFEAGDLSSWTGAIGHCCPITILGGGIIDGRHTLMTGLGTDPNTDGVISVVAPGGGLHTVRLGNDNAGAEAERLAYTLQVDASNALFIYRYAVVLEDPNHEPDQQPRFEIRMFDANGQSINCGMYNVYSTSGIPGFVTLVNQFGQTVNYKDWTTVGMDLTPYIGESVTIEFSTGDCSLGGHYGYAYIDCHCSPLMISSGYCPGLDTARLAAPEGFASYLWSTGETTAAITVDNPATGDEYSCELTSVTGCTVTLSATLAPSMVTAGFGHAGLCMNNVQFMDASVVNSGPGLTRWEWSFGDGGTSDIPDPFHAFNTPGDQMVQLVVESVPGCADTMVQTISLIPAPVAGFYNSTSCFGTPLHLHDTTTSGSPLIGLAWDLGDGTTVDSLADVTHVFAQEGNYLLTLVATAANGCVDTASASLVVESTVYVDLGPDTSLCLGDPWPLDAGNPGLANQWSTGGAGQGIQPDTSGTYWVQVTDSVGCLGRDTVHLVFTLPALDVLSDTTLCPQNGLVLHAGNPGSTYQWSTGESTASISVPPVSGTYSVTVTTAGGCTMLFDANVQFLPAISVNLGPDMQLCTGDTVMLGLDPVPGASFTWNNGSHDPSASFTSSTVAWLSADNGICTSADTVQLIFHPWPEVQLQDTTLCITDPLNLDAGNPGCAYLWTTGDTLQHIIVGGVPGTFGVTVTSPGGCSAYGEAHVTVLPEVFTDLGPDQLHCEGERVVLDAGATPGATYLWSTGDTTRTAEFGYSTVVMVTVSNGHCTAQDTVQLLFNPYPGHAPLTRLDICFEAPGTTVLLQGGTNASLIEWAGGAVGPELVVDSSGVYVVVSSNPPGCSITDTILVEEHCPPRVFIPNAFTPNEDGYNDRFVPVCYNTRIVEFTIFDRKGGVVFQMDGESIGWNGRYRGKNLPIGVYNWRVVYAPVRKDGHLAVQQMTKGHVVLIR